MYAFELYVYNGQQCVHIISKYICVHITQDNNNVTPGRPKIITLLLQCVRAISWIEIRSTMYPWQAPCLQVPSMKRNE